MCWECRNPASAKGSLLPLGEEPAEEEGWVWGGVLYGADARRISERMLDTSSFLLLFQLQLQDLRPASCSTGHRRVIAAVEKQSRGRRCGFTVDCWFFTEMMGSGVQRIHISRCGNGACADGYLCRLLFPMATALCLFGERSKFLFPSRNDWSWRETAFPEWPLVVLP